MKRIAIYPGSFDPITNGHLDILQRASKAFDEIIILVASNDEKKGRFSVQERLEMIQGAIKGMKNVKFRLGDINEGGGGATVVTFND